MSLVTNPFSILSIEHTLNMLNLTDVDDGGR